VLRARVDEFAAPFRAIEDCEERNAALEAAIFGAAPARSDDDDEYDFSH
jgi:hypothetical protein